MTLIRLAGLMLALTALFTLTGCGKDDEPPPPAAPAAAVRFDSRVPPSQQEAIRQAFAALYAYPLTSPDPALADLGKLSDTSPATLQAWLENRVRYVMPEAFDYDSRLWAVSTPFTYENPGQYPDIPTSSAQEGKGQVVMSNPGALLYCLGKRENKLLALELDGHGMVYVKSPRTGLLQVGSGMFGIPASSRFSPSLTQKFHLSVLIHEARHSDGNRQRTGFFHAECTSGDYKGKMACDNNTNGPYSLGAAITKSLLQSCAGCPTREAEILRLIYLDDYSRILPGSSRWDDAPEGQP